MSKLKSQNSKVNKNSSQDSSKQSSLMAQLMAKHTQEMASLKKGEVVKGKITKLTQKEVLVNINAKTDALVLERDHKLLRNLLNKLRVGDTVTVSVLDPESDNGYPVVSLRRFMGDAMWETLEALQKNRTPIRVTVSSVTKGGFVVATDDGMSGFLPNSQLGLSEHTQRLLGKTVEVAVLEVARATNKIIFSQKALSMVSDFKEVKAQLKIGQKIEAIVSNITQFGVFVSIPLGDEKFVDGLLHISEVAWERSANLEESFTPGQTIELVIIGFDTEAGRVDVSVKRLTEDPFAEIVKQFSLDMKVSGKVTKVTEAGVEVQLTKPALEEGQAEVMIKKEKMPPTIKYDVGSSVTAVVSEIDAKRHRILLTPVLLEKPIGYR